jgi:hypothetical protein
MKRASTMLAAVLGATLGSLLQNATAQELKTIRIGWQPTTTVEAQIAHTLAKTDILERNGLKGELTMFSFGPAVNEALVSGSIDVGFIGDMPSVSLAAAGAPTSVIAPAIHFPRFDHRDEQQRHQNRCRSEGSQALRAGRQLYLPRGTRNARRGWPRAGYGCRGRQHGFRGALRRPQSSQSPSPSIGKSYRRSCPIAARSDRAVHWWFTASMTSRVLLVSGMISASRHRP